MGSEWFNTETMEEATSNDVQEIQIPAYLHPNLKTFRFVFNAKRHEFVFQHYAEGLKLTHNSALNFMKNIVSDKRVKRKFGDVKVSIINEKGGIDKIFSIPRITELEVFIETPNSDVWGADFEEQAESHLEDKNARSMNVTYKSKRGEGIERDEDLNALIRASINNGHSVARGYGDAGHMEVRTSDFPKVEREMYSEDVEPGSVFRRLARAFRR